MRQLIHGVLLAAATLIAGGVLYAQSVQWEQIPFPLGSGFFSTIIGMPDGTVLGLIPEEGLYRSDDKGDSWEKLPATGHSLRKGTDGVLILTARSNVFISDNAGATWQSVFSDLPLNNIAQYLHHSSGCHFVINNQVFTEQDGLLRSDDAGDTWTNVFDSTATKSFVEASDGLLLCAFSKFSGNINGEDILRHAGVNRSSNKGESWQPTSLFDPNIEFIDLHKLSDGTVFASASMSEVTPGRLWRSTDAGSTWSTTSLTDYMWRVLEFPDGTLYATAVNSGVYRSRDGGKTWSSQNNGLADSRVFGIGAHRDGTLFTCDFFSRAFRSTAPVISAIKEAGDPGTALSIAPNPGEEMRLISFTTQRQEPVRLEIVNLRGETEARLLDAVLEAGDHQAAFNTHTLSGGMYFVVLHSAGATVTASLIVSH